MSTQEADTPPKGVKRPAPDGKGKLKRRAVACKACHSLKVKCIPSDPENPSSPCVRCLKSKKHCDIDVPQGKKKKKPEDRVAELELKLEQLTSQLQGASPVSQSSDGSFGQASPSVGSGSLTNAFQGFSPHIRANGSTQRSSLTAQRQQQTRMPTEYVSETESAEQHRKARIKKAQLIEEKFGPKELQALSADVTSANQIRVAELLSDPVDIIDSGLITLEEAQARFKLYHDIFVKYPFVEIPSDLNELRNEHKVLFTITMAVMGLLRPTSECPEIETNLHILNLAQKEMLNEVMFIGNKSLDLVKCLVLWSVWYNAPEMFHHRRYHMFSNLCISLVHDLGLTGRPFYVVHRQDGAFRRSTAFEDSQKDECRCLVLSTYCLSTGYMLFLRRKLPVIWTPYLEECSHLLRISKDPKRRTIGCLAKLTSIMERIDTLFGVDEQENHPLIKLFAHEVQLIREESITMDDVVVKAFATSIEAFLYSKFTAKELAMKCLQASIDCIECFSNMSPEQMNQVPLLIFGRLMYCFALFLKTCNNLQYDFDLEFVERLLNKMKLTTQTYRNNHIVIKTLLLLHFYLTTFAKNADVFNSINEVSSTHTILKSVSEEQLGDERPDLHTSNSVPNMSNFKSAPNSQFPALGGHPTSESTIPGMSGNVELPPIRNTSNGQLIGGSNHPFDPFSASAVQNLVYGNQNNNQTNNNSNNNNSNNQSNASNALNNNNGVNGGYPTADQLFGDTQIPRLDMLSDATMKGFVDVPNDLLGSQEEFWKLFDYKQDDQFYL